MTLATLTREHAFPTSALAEDIRASVPKMHCRACDQRKHWSNPSDDTCDDCQQGNPLAIMANSHGVPWRQHG